MDNGCLKVFGFQSLLVHCFLLPQIIAVVVCHWMGCKLIKLDSSFLPKWKTKLIKEGLIAREIHSTVRSGGQPAEDAEGLWKSTGEVSLHFSVLCLLPCKQNVHVNEVAQHHSIHLTSLQVHCYRERGTAPMTRRRMWPGPGILLSLCSPV